MWSGPAMGTGQSARHVDAAASYPGQSMPLRAQSSPSISQPAPANAPALSDPGLLLPPQIVLAQRSWFHVFGWLVLAAVLFGGVSTLVYLAFGERNAAKAADALTGTAAAAPGSAGSSGSATLVRTEPERGSAAVAPADLAAQQPDAVTSGGAIDERSERAHKKQPTTATLKAAPNKRAPAEELRPGPAMSKAAEALENAGKWSEARAMYQKLGQNKAYAAESLYHQAVAAFQLNAYHDAETLAADAAHYPAFKVRALLLYGDAIFRQGDIKRAKDIFITLRSHTTGNDKATATKKITACNKELKLPELDGVK
jgi:hypothetical protein